MMARFTTALVLGLALTATQTVAEQFPNTRM